MRATKAKQKTGRAVINTILITVAILLIAAVFTSKHEEATDFIKGYIKKSDINSQETYTATLIDFYETDHDWFPKTENNTSTQPSIAGDAGIIVDINSSEILFSKDANKKRPIASLTKIMTAVIALEHKSLGDKIYITRNSAEVGENSMGLSYGEVYTLEELMYGLVLHSGNDSAYAIAEGVAGDVDNFVNWMNIKAQELGLKNTYFADPSGLDDSTYSTPSDLVKLTRYALKNPDFKEIVATFDYEIFNDRDNKYMYLQNQTNLLSTYPGVAGVKTGFTEEAGLCLVTYSMNEGKEVIGVVLNSIDRKGDMILMLDHSFNTLGVMVEHDLLY